ncbi:transposase [Ekhidna sp.]|uniref:transposase n=1 Tax=Ekhidna sp. TaxID=2608089 RepID=UPI003CCBE489
MPNHIHLIWRTNSSNGKETPFGSFLKYTAHEFKKMLEENELQKFKVDVSNKRYEFWQRDSMAIELYSPKVVYQKLDYIHENPIAKDWNLANEASEYMNSSASFYEFGDNRFAFLKHICEVY